MNNFFTSADLEANRAGQITPEQHVRVQRAIFARIRSFGAALLVSLLVPWLVSVIPDPAVNLLYGPTLVLPGLVLFAIGFSLMALWADRQRGEARAIQGKLQKERIARFGRKFVAWRIGDRAPFPVEEELFALAESGRETTIFYAPLTGIVLSFEQA